jgi:hypothetical protein
MKTFGLISEGITDQAVISNILIGYFNNKDIPITSLQPILDETDKSRNSSFGGWGNLINYLKSDQLKQSFQFVDFLIIQIDTDICEDYGISKSDKGKVLSVDELIERVEFYLISEIGQFYSKISERIIFAVSVHMIECWLLPLYYDDNKKLKTSGCLNTLNQALNKRINYTIDPDKKDYGVYKEISKPYARNRVINNLSVHNPSLHIFCDKLRSKKIAIV